MPPSRREILTSANAFAASQVLLGEAVAEERNPAALVADRTSTLKIKKLTATPVGPKVFVKIETTLGVTGWGEIDQLEPTVAAALARSLFELLDGENPTRIEYLWQ